MRSTRRYRRAQSALAGGLQRMASWMKIHPCLLWLARDHTPDTQAQISPTHIFEHARMHLHMHARVYEAKVLVAAIVTRSAVLNTEIKKINGDSELSSQSLPYDRLPELCYELSHGKCYHDPLGERPPHSGPLCPAWRRKECRRHRVRLRK